MIPTALAIAFFATCGICYLLGHAEGRNKGHDLEEEAFMLGFDTGHELGWREARILCESVSGQDWVGSRVEAGPALERRNKIAKAHWEIDEEAFRKAHGIS